jgi:hypothetical protein
MYQVLKDFAGPIATIIAAFAAAYFARHGIGELEVLAEQESKNTDRP